MLISIFPCIFIVHRGHGELVRNFLVLQECWTVVVVVQEELWFFRVSDRQWLFACWPVPYSLSLRSCVCSFLFFPLILSCTGDASLIVKPRFSSRKGQPPKAQSEALPGRSATNLRYVWGLVFHCIVVGVSFPFSSLFLYDITAHVVR